MSANLSAVPKLQFFDNNGNPLVGGKLYTYAAGTTTPLATYTDAGAGTPNTNPIILDSRGEANVWLSAVSYKFVLKDASDATIWTVDDVSNAINTSQILASSGSAAAPPYTFASDTTTGMYLAAVGQLGLAVSGVPVLRSNSTAMTIGQSGGANDVDVTHYGDTTQTGNFTLTGDVNVTGAAVFNEAGADKDFRVEGDTDPNLLFVDASTDRVGIGTSSPNDKLTVVAASGAVFVAVNNNTVNLLVGVSAGNVGLIGTTTNQAVLFYANNAEQMRITSAGLVGIGTNAPANRLHVSSGATDEVARFEGTGSPYISLYDSGVREFFIQTTGGGINVYGETNKPMLFYTNSVGRFQIAADGAQSSVIPAGSTLYPQFACRAWINFDGTGTPTARASGNVSSITDNGTGDYTINFTTAMPDANYAVTGMAMGNTGAAEVIVTTPGTVAWAVGSVRIGVRGGSGTLADQTYINVAVFR